MRRSPKLSAGTLLRGLIAILALGWIIHIVDWGRMFFFIRRFPPTLILAILLISLIAMVPQIWMWNALLDLPEKVSYASVLKVDLVVKFINNLFPSRISGRSVAPIALKHFTVATWAEATAVTGAHTGLYAIFYALACAVGFFILAPQLGAGILSVIGLSTVVYIAVAVLVVLLGWNLERFESVLDRIGDLLNPIPLIGRWIRDILTGTLAIVGDSAEKFRTILSNPKSIFGYGISWVLALMVIPGIRIYLLFLGFDLSIPQPWLLPFYLITAYAVTILPLTPGGIGVAEVTSTLVFVGLGFPSEIVVPVVVLDRFLGIYIPALAGWYPAMTVDFASFSPLGNEGSEE